MLGGAAPRTLPVRLCNCRWVAVSMGFRRWSGKLRKLLTSASEKNKQMSPDGADMPGPGRQRSFDGASHHGHWHQWRRLDEGYGVHRSPDKGNFSLSSC